MYRTYAELAENFPGVCVCVRALYFISNHSSPGDSLMLNGNVNECHNNRKYDTKMNE